MAVNEESQGVAVLEGVSTLTELWGSPEWKRLRREYVEGKACEWCGARAGDTYTTRKGETRAVGLAPHHIEKHPWGKTLYRQVRRRLFNKWYSENKALQQYMIPPGLSEREYRKTLEYEWARDNRLEISEAFEEEKRRVLGKYVELTPENVIILCSRCHFAREKGLLICPVCKENHRQKRYATCYRCSRKTGEAEP
jgi:hypothetical protein